MLTDRVRTMTDSTDPASLSFRSSTVIRAPMLPAPATANFVYPDIVFKSGEVFAGYIMPVFIDCSVIKVSIPSVVIEAELYRRRP